MGTGCVESDLLSSSPSSWPLKLFSFVFFLFNVDIQASQMRFHTILEWKEGVAKESLVHLKVRMNQLFAKY